MATTVGINQSGTGGVLLPDAVLDKLYQSYALKQKRVAFACYLIASILFDVWAIAVPQGQSVESIGKGGEGTGLQCNCNNGKAAAVRHKNCRQGWCEDEAASAE